MIQAGRAIRDDHGNDLRIVAEEKGRRSATMAAMHLPAFRSLALSLIATAPVFAQQVDMRTTAKKGASVWLLQEQVATRAIEMMGQEVENTETTRRVLHVTVDDVDAEGNLTVTTRLVRIHGSVKSSDERMSDLSFDSAKPFEEPENDPTGGMMSMMLKRMTQGAGKSFVAKVDPFGKVMAMIDTKAMGAEGELPALPDETLGVLVEAAFGNRATKPLALQDSWNHESTEQGAQGLVVMKAKLVLAKAEAEAFEITSTGTIEKQPEPTTAAGDEEDENPFKAMRRSMKLSNGKAVGASKLSRTDGFLLEGKLETSMDIEMGDGAMSMTMAIKQVTTTKRITEAEAMPKKAEASKAAETPKPAETGK